MTHCWLGRSREPNRPTQRSRRRARATGGDSLGRRVGEHRAHGVTAVTAAIEALLAALLDILGRLIGGDMATRLID